MLLLELKLTNPNCNRKDPPQNHHLQYQGTGIHRLQRISVKLVFTKNFGYTTTKKSETVP